ncbi:hypothetical protein ACWIGM_05065 [Bosea sp. NPDC055332]
MIAMKSVAAFSLILMVSTAAHSQEKKESKTQIGFPSQSKNYISKSPLFRISVNDKGEFQGISANTWIETKSELTCGLFMNEIKVTAKTFTENNPEKPFIAAKISVRVSGGQSQVDAKHCDNSSQCEVIRAVRSQGYGCQEVCFSSEVSELPGSSPMVSSEQCLR